ncbi:MAG: hypothetical protein JO199_03665, partial [Candidatus Eremiobacteraeota bacterium]|nr:hypothetical protein [Candidatus Eremiobacteraeota bacterium]
MKIVTTVCSAAAFAVALGCSGAVAAAKATPSPVAQTSPAPAQSGTILDRDYNGKIHWNLTPYVWLPSINGNLQFQVPA